MKALEGHTLAIAILVLVAWNATASHCHAQNSPGYPNFGFRSYASGSTRNYNTGFGGMAQSNSFNSGFASISNNANQYAGTAQQYPPTQQVTQYRQTQYRGSRPTPPTPYSTAALNQLIGNVKSISQSAHNANGGQGLLPGVSKQEMLRIFLEGGSPDPGGGGFEGGFGGAGVAGPGSNQSANTSNAYSNYQRAENEANKARNYAERARYGSDQWNRKNAASQAEYAANNANYAAERAESAAYSGDSQARHYAGLARQAANRARYNADTTG